ncbi:MAG: hypothetical protein ABFD96_05985 [Armatimonadia bacterium]
MDVSKKNHGTVKTRVDGNTTIVEAYGKDDSDVTGSAKKERGPHNMGGSITNLSHSLSGTSANQKGS